MKRKKYLAGIVFILVLFLFGFQECVIPGPVGPTPQSGVEKASVNGKYNDLLNVIDVPDDRSKYGEFYELGYKKWTKYRGYQDLGKGYWVYVYPSWYIWKTKTTDEVTDNTPDKETPNYDKGSVSGKYSRLLKTLSFLKLMLTLILMR